MKEDKKNKPLEDDIFLQSAKQSFHSIPAIITIRDNEKEENITEANIKKLPTIIRRSFEEIGIGMDQEHAERFNNILSTLPDREFVRVYLKALEFFKPKVVRTEPAPNEKEDKGITVIIKR